MHHSLPVSLVYYTVRTTPNLSDLEQQFGISHGYEDQLGSSGACVFSRHGDGWRFQSGFIPSLAAGAVWPLGLVGVLISKQPCAPPWALDLSQDVSKTPELFYLFLTPLF